MASKRTPGSKPGLIRCDHCGEQYSETYRRCPFCDEYNEYEDEYESDGDRSVRGGGKRLVTPQRRGGGYTRTSPLKVISIIISLAIIAAAAWIVVTQLWPLIQRGSVGTVDPNSSVTQPVDPDPGATPDATDPEPGTTDPAVEPPDTTPTSNVTPPADTTPPSDSGGATGFSLSSTDFAFTTDYPDPVTLKVTFTPTGATGTITWTSSNPDVATVDANGKVSRGSKKGSATITATLSNGVTQTCTVYNQIGGSGSSSASGTSGTSSGTYTVNNPDFTFYTAGEQYQLTVNGYTGNVSWSSSNTSIVTVSSDGTCTAVGTGKGSCTITGTLDNGSKVEAIARINIS